VIRLEEKTIILVSCGPFEKDITRKIAEDVVQAFQYPVRLIQCSLDIDRFYNPGRRQYDASGILKVVSESSPRDAFRKMGLFSVDLYIPILTYIFGQAIRNGFSGIASLYRLRNELYGLEPDRSLLVERFSKVVIHELGHTFGLMHCNYPVCIMRSGTYVEDLDQKEIHFCEQCRSMLDRAVKF
jgi:archaemetzincin